jgi:uncharacterized pyridoxal phosphate-containing UPF0001 family protein
MIFWKCVKKMVLELKKQLQREEWVSLLLEKIITNLKLSLNLNMKTLFTVLFLFIIQIFSAQEEDYEYADGVFHFEENKTQKIFTDWTRIRQSPNVNAQILDSLQTNQQICNS